MPVALTLFVCLIVCGWVGIAVLQANLDRKLKKLRTSAKGRQLAGKTALIVSCDRLHTGREDEQDDFDELLDRIYSR